jgi:O-antigen/teichoic acid export membrane protein
MVLYAGSFPLLAFRGGSFAVLTAFEEFRRLSLLYVLDSGLSFLLVVTFLLAGYGVVGMVLGMAIGNALIGLISLGIATSLLIRNGADTWWKGSFKSIAHLRGELFSFFGWNYLMSTLGGAITHAPVMFLGAIRGAEEAGFFRLALSLMTATSYPTSAAGRVVYPRLSGRWAAGERESDLEQSLKRWTRRGGLSLGFGIALMIPFLPWIVPLLFGEGYRPMVPGAQIMFVAAAVTALFFWLNSYYYATGRVGTWTRGFALYTVLVLGLGWPSIHWWGFIGMAAVFAVGKICFSLLMFTKTRVY